MREKVSPAGLIADRIKKRGGSNAPIIEDITVDDVLWCVETLFNAIDAAVSHAAQTTDRGLLITSVRQSINERCLGWDHPDEEHPMQTVLMNPTVITRRRERSRHRELMFTLLYEPLILKLGLTYDDLMVAPVGFVEDLHQVIETFKAQEKARREEEVRLRAANEDPPY